MDLLSLATGMLSEKLGLTVDPDTIASALQSLLGGADGELDLAGLAGRFASSGGLGEVLGSWLGDGENASISAQTILDVLGRSDVSAFADQVGTDTQSAAAGLSDVIPQLLDKASSGGELLESLGGAGGLLGMAKSFLR
jgi:uncharacterized protein YidB (DUF937 family)